MPVPARPPGSSYGAGFDVVATEPDAQMLAELRIRVPRARSARAAFEQVATSATYDLVYAAAALHWTDPDTRWSRVAELLRPGGTFASFGGPARLAHERHRDAVEAVRRPDLDDDEVPPPDGTRSDGDGMRWPGTELQRSTLFDDVRQSTIHRRVPMTTVDYVGYLSTVSAYLQLPTARRVDVLNRIADALPERVEVCSDIDVHLARRR